MKSVSEMSNSEIDTELAERMGWHKRVDENWDRWDKVVNNIDRFVISCDDWHPSISLDQCRVVEEEKMNGNEMMYLDNLDEVLLRQYGEVPMKQQISFYYAVHATARQKAEALLMTLREVENG